MSAVLSSCGKYRYVLHRSLGSVFRWHRPVLFIMLNPSIADAEVNDPTIKSCMRISQYNCFTHMTVVNLFALRSTDPSGLLTADDPVGPCNDIYFSEQVEKHRNSAIIAAWGNHKMAKIPGDNIKAKIEDIVCLGKNKNGSPKHPLYMKTDSPLVEFK